jgi:hypothetical protein
MYVDLRDHCSTEYQPNDLSKKSGTLGHCILNDLLEEFGDNSDVQDAAAILYSGEHVFICSRGT